MSDKDKKEYSDTLLKRMLKTPPKSKKGKKEEKKPAK